MRVSAIIVTRGDVDIQPVVDSIPQGWEIVIWENGHTVTRSDGHAEVAPDCAVYGRYAAIEHASHDLIYVQDDDCIVTDPEPMVEILARGIKRDFVVCNMPQEFRHDFYKDHALVGFGAAFHRDAPIKAFGKLPMLLSKDKTDWFNRTCDIVFTALTPRVLVDIPKGNLPCAYAANRMWRQPEHQPERDAMLELVRTLL